MRVSAGAAGVAASFLVIGLTAVPATRVGASTASGAQQAILYVYENGAGCDDKGPGTQAEPFCTVQAAANVVNPGQTVEITAGNANPDYNPLIITRSGTPTEPITFTYGTGLDDPILSGFGVTGHPVIKLRDVHDITLSSLVLQSSGSDDVIDVIGSSDISLERLRITQEDEYPTVPVASAGISIDGGSSDVTISRTLFKGASRSEVLAGAGARQVTVTTNVIEDTRGSGITLDGTTNAIVASNTVVAYCDTPGITSSAVSLANGTSGTVENNILQIAGATLCPSQGAGLSVDARSAGSAGGVKADYNAVLARGNASEYSWAGTSYATVTAFRNGVPGQGTHDVELPGALLMSPPPEGSPAIDSADCSAPGELSTDFIGQPRVADPLATDASLGNGTCHADRGAYERQDAMPITYTRSPVLSSGTTAGTVPFTSGVTITSGTTSAWKEPISYTVDFGDGTASAAATPGTEVTHMYTTPGQYTVTITATDTSGSADTATYTAFALTDQPLTAGLSARPNGFGSSTGISPDTADFTASFGARAWELSSDILAFGDGTRATSPEPDANGQVGWTHTYGTPGTHTATITVTDLLGRVTTTKVTITVGDEPVGVNPARVFSNTVAAHAVVKIPLSKLTPGWPARAALVDVIVTNPRKGGYVTVYPNGTPRPGFAAVQFQAGKSAENSALATGATVDFYNGSAGPIHLAVVTYGIDYVRTSPYYGSFGDTYAPVAPARVLRKTRIAGGHTVAFRVAGLDGVPASASDVVLDITVSGTITAGAFDTGPENGYPGLDSLTGGYWAKGQQVTDLAMVPVNGRVIVGNAGRGAADFTADVVGYYVPGGSDAVFLPATPHRLLQVKIAGKHFVKLVVGGKNGVPATGTTAVSLNVTASGATANGSVTAYADGTTRPAVTSLSYDAAAPVANAAIVDVGPDGAIDLYNDGAAPVAVTVDLTGSYYAYPPGA